MSNFGDYFWQVYGVGSHDFWPYNTTNPAEDTQPRLVKPEPEEDEPYDDSKDHEACTDCNPRGQGRTPGWYQPLVGPPVLCDRCDGAGWV